MGNKMIGIVGGVGSYAGLDLIRKIYDHTDARSDQEHLPVSMLSVPHTIGDRTEYLLGVTDVNPGRSIAGVITTLVSQGAEVIGIPCNTAHASSIYDVILEMSPDNCKIIHMIEEVAREIVSSGAVSKIGLLGTTGTLSSDIYKDTLAGYGIEVIYPSADIQSLFVHPAIYHHDYGIKVYSNPVITKARDDLFMAASYLSRKGAEAIILGCTEIPLALTEGAIDDVPLIDATTLLAKALIRESQAA
ncbi:aspartate/glutamate racemase family protein [Paremcibacter congregatus]|uniref:Aspartate racemase n=2 Tax=Paremcibacter congregatus TaxID=2043170 RepID=A0A2G4YT51_9PROT|nr:amino acid racemase [Paremcibacter congregatus]PHZ85501.1 aspartate racemase [Paremcibacter congregatus]QDE29241.1 aspartate/glutamate racemase family protein [Paremcibacter congregatus]